MLIKEIIQRILNKIAFFGPGGSSLRPWLQRLRGVRLGKKVWISQYVYMDELHPEQISIGDNCTIGLRVSIFSHFYWGGKRGGEAARPVTIGKDVFIGPHCVILPGVHIGDGAVIQAGCAVSRNVAPHIYWGAQAGGPLAEVSVALTSENGYERFVSGMRPLGRRKQNH